MTIDPHNSVNCEKKANLPGYRWNFVKSWCNLSRECLHQAGRSPPTLECLHPPLQVTPCKFRWNVRPVIKNSPSPPCWRDTCGATPTRGPTSAGCVAGVTPSLGTLTSTWRQYTASWWTVAEPGRTPRAWGLTSVTFATDCSPPPATCTNTYG